MDRVLRRFERPPGLLAMPGDHLVGRGRDGARHDEIDDALVQLAAAGLQEAVVRRLLDEDVAKAVGRPSATAAAADDPFADKLAERRIQREGQGFRVEDLRQHVDAEFAPDGAGHLRHAAELPEAR